MKVATFTQVLAKQERSEQRSRGYSYESRCGRRKAISLAGLLCAITLLVSLPVLGQDAPAPGVNIHMAALLGNVEAIQAHIETGSDLNPKDAYGSTPLIIATTFDKTDAAIDLIEAGADLSISNNNGGTPLHAAAFLCRTEIVKALLDKGANKYLRDNFGSTPLESVSAPFENVKSVYDSFGAALGPVGLRLDYEHIKATRPKIAEMLQPRPEELDAVEYTPIVGEDWNISTPSEQELDPKLVAEMYLSASGLEKLYGLLVIKNGRLIAEGYFNEGTVDQKVLLQSASKSYFSALVGIALEQGCLTSLDQKMMDFFPEYLDQITDPRKQQITIRQLLQMRSGYPWEETDPALWEELMAGDLLPLIIDVPLVTDPGAAFHYSNLTTHILGVITARACETDLKSFAEEYLLKPLGVEAGEWWQDDFGYHYPLLEFTARDAARFGLLYLNDGEWEGDQIVSRDWVSASLFSYSGSESIDEAKLSESGRYFNNLGYGYQWWSASAGDFRFDFAWGHGGQLIIVLEELDMIVVTTSDPFFNQHNDESWKHERMNLDLVGRFIASLPKE